MKTSENANETALIEKLVGGDKAAFGLIYKTYLQEILGYTRRSLTNPEDAKEIIHDVFESLWLRHKSLSHVTSIRHYLYSAVRYKIIRYFSHQGVKKRYEEHYRCFEAAYDTIPEKPPGPDSLQQKILEALEPLPPRCRLAMKLRLIENLSNSEIAEQMNIAKDTVENYMVKAVNHLRNSLSPSMLRD